MYRMADVGVIRLSDGSQIMPDLSARDWQDYQEWLSAGNIPDPAPTIVVAVSLSEARAQRRMQIGNETAARIGLLVPGDVALGALALAAEIWRSIAASARAPTAKLSKMIAIVQAALTAVAAVDAATTVADVAAVTVAWPP